MPMLEDNRVYASEGSMEEPDYDLDYLPEDFDDEDFDLVSKEVWLQGFWLKKLHPGAISVHVEIGFPNSGCLIVANYYKKWMGKKWVLKTPGGEEFDERWKEIYG